MDNETSKFWNRELADILNRIKDHDTLQRLESTLRRVTPFDISVAFAYPDGRAPILLYNGLNNTSQQSVLDAYMRGTYLLDPFYLACSNQILPGLYRMSSLAPDEFFSSEYYHSPSVHPCISMESGSLTEEIGYFVPLHDGSMAAFSLMRSNGSEPFSEHEFSRLLAIEPMVRHVLSRHWQSVPSPHNSVSSNIWAIQGEAMELAFDRFAADLLTRRQRLIVQLILRGHSNLSVGLRLGITEGTAKIHRKAIYDRLGISSQSELFSMFINFLVLPT